MSEPDQSSDARRFSDVLEQLASGADARLSLRELVNAFGERGFGALILVLSLLALLPWPPGGKAVFGIPIILLSIELALQRDQVWLPRWVLRASVSRSAFGRGIRRIMRPVRFVENLTRPRLLFMTGDVADVFTGLICVLLAMMMALPIPFGDMLPGVALALFALGMMQRDGVAVLLGVVGACLCGLYLFLIWTTVVEVGGRVWQWATGLF
ncbi:exopolysaccharide biosynthesis protein [Brevundimonas sp. PAMC22021]|uniref:exopolysaccharide biosynthesis protein n=1 Tax=Brevundimonas sp. PAMC22021 TaxID=2861285 RepID=UPI001C63B30A|nr:exopolysaccharide biosynthesis protein [Brevundimonas sp. PAMC22021]QYF87747.1 exopolysaccharide biosynthesis protein [Brevundimonas sp. PAMC22021]